MTRTVRDAALMLGVMAGPDPRDPLTIDAPPEDYLAACDGDLTGRRVAWSPDLGFAAVDPEVRRVAEAAARRFADLGAHVDAPAVTWPNPREFHQVIWEVGVAARNIDRALERPDWIEPSLAQILLNAGRWSAIQYQKALLARTEFQNAVRRFFGDYELLLTPQMPIGAWSAEPGAIQGPREIDGRPTPTIFDRLPFTYPFNLTGQPAASVPCGFTAEGLPVGLQIVGRWHADALVLRASAAFESIQPWAHRRPPMAD